MPKGLFLPLSLKQKRSKDKTKMVGFQFVKENHDCCNTAHYIQTPNVMLCYMALT